MPEENVIEELLETIQSAMYMLTGMQLDPSIPNHAKSALKDKADELNEMLAKHNQ